MEVWVKKIKHQLTPEELIREIEARAYGQTALVIITVSQWKTITEATFFPGASATFFSAPFAFGFGSKKPISFLYNLKKALILSSTVITLSPHLRQGADPDYSRSTARDGLKRQAFSKPGPDFPSTLPPIIRTFH